MTSGQKVALSTLFSVALFGAFVFVTKTDFVPEIEKRFYTQSKVQQKQAYLENVTNSLDLYIQNVLNRLEDKEKGYLQSAAVSSYLSQNPAESDTVERRNITEKLFYDYPALKGIRFIDKNGVNLHFSTYDRTDILKQVGIKKYYKNYPDIVDEYKEIDIKKIFSEKTVPAKKVYFDEVKNRVLFVLPVNWLENVYAGCFVFYFDVSVIEDVLLEQAVFDFTDNLKIVSDEKYNGGFVVGVPEDEKSIFTESIKNNWFGKNNSTPVLANQNISKIVTQKDGTSWVIMNSKDSKNYKISLLEKTSFFELSKEFIYLIYFAIYISLFLVIFLLFSLKRDSIYVLQKKIRKIQFGIIKEYLKNQEKIEWKNVAQQLKARNDEITKEIRKSLGRKRKYKSKDIEETLQKSWNEVIDVISSYSPDALGTVSANSLTSSYPTGISPNANSSVTIEQIRQVMEDLLKSTTLNVAATSPVKVQTVKNAVAPVAVAEEIEEISEVEEISDIDEVESLEEVEEISEIEEIKEIDTVGSVEDLNSLEEVEDIEEIEDAEPLEELDEEAPLEVIEIADSIEELEDVEEIEEFIDNVQVQDFVYKPPVNSAADTGLIFGAEDTLEKSIRDNKDVYINSFNFATVENLFKDELCIGSIIVEYKKDTKPLKHKFYKPNFNSSQLNKTEDISKLDDNNHKNEKTQKEVLTVQKKQAVQNASKQKSGLMHKILSEKMETKVAEPTKNVAKKTQEQNLNSLEEIEVLQEATLTDVKFTNQFSMVSFGVNVGDIQELQQVQQKNTQTITEKSGVFSIAEDLEYSKVKVNKDFKNLVDDVLKR